MPVFAVIVVRGQEHVKPRIEAFREEHRYMLKGDTWFIKYDGTTKALAEKIGVRSDERVSGIVLSIQNYGGRAKNSLWEWLNINSNDEEL